MHVIIVHGWKGSPDLAWFPWVISALKERGYTVEALRLPRSFTPDRWTWSRRVREVMERSNPEETIILAHSLGCPTTLFALRDYHGKPFRKIVFVSGFFRPFFVPFVHTWFFGARLDIAQLRNKALSWHVIHGESDPLVPYKRGRELADMLGVPLETICGGGHFTPREKCIELPEVLKAITDS